MLKQYNIEQKLFCITADNASSNKSFAKCLEEHIYGFSSKKHLLGCAAHVLNLAVQVMNNGALQILKISK